MDPAHPRRPLLRRARSGRLLAGVCAGLARQRGWNVATVRILWFVFAAIPVLPGLPAYLLAWLLVPQDRE